MKKILIVCGPTATGKTNLGLKLAKKFNGQIISADSRQVYQGMDIGTGKDKPKNDYKIHGYDLIKPDKNFSVAHFVEFAKPLIKKIQQQNQLPILVGGTGLYLKAITKPFDTISIKPDFKLRQKLNQLTVKQLQAKLKKLNLGKFQSMNHSDQLNPRRLIRAIEVIRPGLSLRTAKTNLKAKDILWIGLTGKKSVLDKQIIKRVDKRIKQGAEKEVKSLLQAGYSWNLPSMSAMGYKQWQPYFTNQSKFDEVRQAWIKAEQQYLRRQLTWFKKQSEIHWFDITNKKIYNNVVRTIKAWYTNT